MTLVSPSALPAAPPGTDPAPPPSAGGSAAAPPPPWEFWIDVGGTFTDGVARRPDGSILTHKVLSTGRFPGLVGPGSDADRVVDPARRADPPDYFAGHRLRCELPGHGTVERPVRRSDPAAGTLVLADPLPAPPAPGTRYELVGDEEAPVAVARWLRGLPAGAPLGAVRVRLGTTRATNALLERRGARVALVTTAGFGDALRIGYQDRPDLFALHVAAPEPLYEEVVEIDERLDAAGRVLRPVSPPQVAARLAAARGRGVEALAVCLLHAYRHPAHEQAVAAAARELGFAHVALSSEISPLPKFVSRAETTVADAYLTPGLRAYCRRLAAQLPGADLWFMTSAGHLVRAEQFSGKDAILSGPAGGLVGASRAARAAGEAAVVTFDMGGTSTDVSRFEPGAGDGGDGGGEAPGLPRRFELEVARTAPGGRPARPLRLQTPALEIETVAAGGGSVCAFDGQMLTVGPRSAGADPGPACYGRGGPLCVTDLNFFLGKLPGFPFPLDRTSVERRLDALAAEVGRRHGRPPGREELAAGLSAIANSHVAAPVRALCLARGEDVRTHTLVCFGGAGGQHACALARELGVRRVLCSPFAGVLSALGIGLAETAQLAEQAVHRPLAEVPAAELAAAFAALENSLRARLAAAGVPAAALQPPRRWLELRYAGQETRLLLPLPPPPPTLPPDPPAASGAGAPAPSPEPAPELSWAERFAREHARRYGFRVDGRAVELYAIRAELAAHPPPWPLAAAEPETASRGPGAGDDDGPPPRPDRVEPVFFDGRYQPTPVYRRERLRPGARLVGPAIVSEATATVVVEPGWTAWLSPGHDLLLTAAGGDEDGRADGSRRGAPLAAAPAPAPDAAATAAVPGPEIPDPATLELFHHRFAAVATQMGVILQRSALSTNVKERLDFSCAVFSGDGRLVANAPHVPVHLGALEECVRCLREEVPAFQPETVYVTNDPFRGGSHLPDVTVVTPVFAADGRRILFFTVNRAHHAEIGGVSPGSLPPQARCLAEEGVLLRTFALRPGDPADEARLRRVLTEEAPYPSRAVEDNLADLRAQVAANAAGAALLREMAARHGAGVVAAYVGHLRRATEAKVRAALAGRLPGPGEPAREFADQLDDGTPLRVRIAPPEPRPRSGPGLGPGHDPDPAAVGPAAVFDFTGSGPVHPGNLNANRAIVASAVLYVLRCLLDEPIPLNAGMLAAVALRVPAGSLLDPRADPDPARCPAVGGGNVETSQRLVDVLLGALGLAAASQGTMNNVLFGRGAAEGAAGFGYYETLGGGAGASPEGDGASAVHVHMTNTRLTDPEILELRYPVRLWEHAVRAGSGGAGRRRGGDGLVRELEFLVSLDLSLLTSRRRFPPYGLHGGQPGATGRNAWRPAGESVWRELPWAVQLRVNPGDRLRLETPGGGGWGAA